MHQNQHTTMLYHGMISIKSSYGMINKRLNMMLPQEAKKCPFQGQQEEGVALSFLRLQGTIFTTETPQDFSGEEAQAPKSRSSPKMAQNRASQGLRVVKHLQTTKHS